ncbi:MAG: filamentous hemagglutinin N-terminal domain-containing protein [Alphaproteobacteria bacterium]|nr:filamentous hemagglutinin N-terminal domain-containing protein [Alphaproteobacteria bacterium]
MNNFRHSLLATTIIAALTLPIYLDADTALAAPQGGIVVGGEATISQGGNRTIIQQSTNRAAIDWQNFSIAADERVSFIVPGGGATLNRVVGNNVSRIDGTLESNGTLYLVNPNGMVFSASSTVTAQNLIASTASITPADFMAGRGNFSRPSLVAGAKISLNGTITAADHGVVGIFAPQIENQGLITAFRGEVVLGGAATAIVGFDDNNLFNFDIGSPDEGQSLVANHGVIAAEDGRIIMTARAAEGLLNAVIANHGRLEANSVSAQGGTVELRAEGGVVTLGESSMINVNGAKGGGTGVIGGLLHGEEQIRNFNADSAQTTPASRVVANSQSLSIAKGAKITADALENGDGGMVTLWADTHTQFSGRISAQGGRVTGNGGFVEVSGKHTLDFQGTVSTLAAHGATGTLLLDPNDITISAAPNSNFVQNGGAFGVNFGNSNINVATLLGVLATNDVTITTTGGITVASAINAPAATHNLSLLAGGDVIINQAINIGGNITLSSNNGGMINVFAALTAQGSITLQTSGTNFSHSNGDIYIAAAITATGDNSDIIIRNEEITNDGLANTQGIYIASDLVAGRNISIRQADNLATNNGDNASGISLLGGSARAGGTISISQNGNISSEGAITGISMVNYNLTSSRGNIYLSQTGAINVQNSSLSGVIEGNAQDILLSDSALTAGGHGNFVKILDRNSNATQANGWNIALTMAGNVSIAGADAGIYLNLGEGTYAQQWGNNGASPLAAQGQDVYFTGGNLLRYAGDIYAIDVSAGGSFTQVFYGSLNTLSQINGMSFSFADGISFDPQPSPSVGAIKTDAGQGGYFGYNTLIGTSLYIDTTTSNLTYLEAANIEFTAAASAGVTFAHNITLWSHATNAVSGHNFVLPFQLRNNSGNINIISDADLTPEKTINSAGALNLFAFRDLTLYVGGTLAQPSFKSGNKAVNFISQSNDMTKGIVMAAGGNGEIVVEATSLYLNVGSSTINGSGHIITVHKEGAHSTPAPVTAIIAGGQDPQHIANLIGFSTNSNVFVTSLGQGSDNFYNFTGDYYIGTALAELAQLNVSNLAGYNTGRLTVAVNGSVTFNGYSGYGLTLMTRGNGAVDFEGANDFSQGNNLTLAASGVVTEGISARIILAPTTRFSVTAVGGISLGAIHNQIYNLGPVGNNGSGAIQIFTDTDLTLNGTIRNLNGGITIITSNGNNSAHTLTLNLSAITAASNGDIALYNQGGTIKLARNLVTQGSNLTLTAGIYDSGFAANENTAYAVTTTNGNLSLSIAQNVLAPNGSILFQTGTGGTFFVNNQRNYAQSVASISGDMILTTATGTQLTQDQAAFQSALPWHNLSEFETSTGTLGLGSTGNVTWTIESTGISLTTPHNITLYDINYTRHVSVTAGRLTVAGAANFNNATVVLATTNGAITLNAAVTAANLTVQSHAGIAGSGEINAKIVNGTALGDVTLNGAISSLTGFTVTGGNFNLNNSGAIRLSGTFLANNFRLAAPSVVLTDATNIAPNQNGGGSLIWVNNGENWSFAGNENALNLGSPKAAFSSISFSGGLSAIGSAKIYAQSPLGWPNGATIQSGANTYEAPRYSFNMGSILVSVVAPVQAVQPSTPPVTVANPVNQARVPDALTVANISVGSVQSNIAAMSNNMIGRGIATHTTQQKYTTKESSGSPTSDESTNIDANKKGRISPILMAFYETYGPYVQESEDLSLNYLYPMQGNQDLWGKKDEELK